MEKEFIPYEQALALKELGFDEPCLGFRKEDGMFEFFATPNRDNTNSVFGYYPTAPTFSQAFRWFREKYFLYHFVTREIGINTSEIFFVASYYKGEKGNSPRNTCVSSITYEEAELECLKELIEIVKRK
jgi:hypothetical protein